MKSLRSLYQQLFPPHSSKRLLLTNVSYIGVFQGLTLLLPLVSYPYLIRVVGADGYGRVAYAQALVAFVSIVINFGFNILATKDVARHRDDPSYLDRLVSTIYLLKSLLLIASVGVYVAIVSIGESFADNRLLLYLSIGYCLPEWLLPVWYFTGIEKLKYVTLVDAIAKISFTLLIFVLITSPEHLLRIPVVQTVGALIGAVVAGALLFGKRGEGRRFVRISPHELWLYVQEALPFFLSRVSAVTIQQLTTVVIARYLGYVETAWWDLARKIFNLLMIPCNALNTALYPRIAHSLSRRVARAGLWLQGGMGALLFVALYISAPWLISWLGGPEMLPATPTVRYYGVIVLLSHISYYIGSPVMVPFGLAGAFNRSVLLSLVVYLALMCGYLALDTMSLMPLITISIATEAFLLSYRLRYCLKARLFSPTPTSLQ